MKWIGHTLRKPYNDISRKTLDLNPQGRGGRPVNTWRMLVEAETLEASHTWTEIEYYA